VPTDPRGHFVKIEVTDDAATLLRKRGGTLTVDYIRPTG
jgi:hypothetical protein